jgi:hypothetical protein
MIFTLQSRGIAPWPSLAWIAVCRRADPTIEIFHGLGVEIAPDWYCEAVWAGPFEEGDFDKSDLVFGSGGRIRPGSIVFVSSGTTLDRLHSIEREDSVLVSNSLPCLLWFGHARLDQNYTQYFHDFDTLAGGFERYKPSLATSAGPVRLTYFHNLLWDGNQLAVIKKELHPRDFSDFSKYRQFLDHSLEEIAGNMSAAGRQKRFSMIGTMSSGYDSACAAALALPHGLQEVFSFKTGRGGEDDSGTRVADALGFKLLLIGRDAWRDHTLPEVPFLATQASGGDVFFRGAEDRLPQRVLITGFHGDKVWGTMPWEGANEMSRGDTSGTGLSEYRLSVGFIHIPLPFLGATQSTDIVRISQAPEMNPWRLSNWYDRPICRRILEEAGVPRDAFGMTKKAVSIIFWQNGDFLTPQSRSDCRSFLRANGLQVRTPGSTFADILAFLFRHLGRFILKVLPARNPGRRISAIRARVLKLVLLGSGSDPLARSKRMPLTTNDRMFSHIFVWAIHKAEQRYAQAEEFTNLRQANGK